MPEIVIPHVKRKLENGVLTDRSTLDFLSNAIDLLTNAIERRRSAQDDSSRVAA
jgi:chromate reductase, NAD(P)H dehydrogenase (quinone)